MRSPHYGENISKHYSWFRLHLCPSALRDTNNPTDAKGWADDLIAESVFDITIYCTPEANRSVDR
jgi:hypothetical protein